MVTRGGKRVRRKVTGRIKTEVRTKLRDLRRDLDSGVRTSATYTVGADLLWAAADSRLYAYVVLSVTLLGRDIARVLRRPPVAAVALWLIVAIPSLLQLPFPGLLHALERDPDQIRQHGQWWRLFTAAVVQESGRRGDAGQAA